MAEQANIIEVFSSIQGEGKFVGCRQVFVRFSGCNLQCRYCDTQTSHNLAAEAVVECEAGLRKFRHIKNPITADALADDINALLRLTHHSVSFTGGEPLLHAEFLQVLLPKIKGKVFLETNGTLPDALSSVLPDIDFISMDIKLPHLAGRELWEEHRSFLRQAVQKDVYVKLVVAADTTMEDFCRAVDLVAEIDVNIPFVIQPVTPVNGCVAAAPDTVLAFQAKALEMLHDVRVIPQTHKFIGQM